MDIKEFVEQYQADHKAIMENGDLTESGKQKQLKKLEKDLQDTVRDGIKDLRLMVINAGLTYRTAAQANKVEDEQAREKLDYSRLSYEAAKAKSLISGARDINAVVDAWEKVKASRDPYQIQAWADTAAGVVRDRKEDTKSLEWARLLSELRQANANYANKTPISAAEREAVQTLREINSQAYQIDQVFGTGHGGVIKRVMAGVELDKDGANVAFEAQEVKRANGRVEHESADEVFIRLEREHEAKAELAARGSEAFDVTTYDPDGLRVIE